MEAINQEANQSDIEDLEVLDEASSDDSQAPVQYNITSFGVDYDVDGLVKRLERGDIFVPPFQREYVWNLNEASRFIESLLLGLPVPGIFLAKETETNKLLIIDGQQRLKSLLFFYKGVFNPKEGDKRQRIFRLSKVQEQFEGKTYNDLEEKDRIMLDDSILHATVVKQESPEKDDTSIYHVFERLNTGGKKLSAQEIRSVAYHGKLIQFLLEINENSEWRMVYGNPNSRLKDQELILRFLAIYYSLHKYAKPMGEFLNKFAGRNRNPSDAELEAFSEVFSVTISKFREAVGNRIFRPERSLNAAVFDSAMYGLAKTLQGTPYLSKDQIQRGYTALLDDEEYIKLITQSTSDEANVARRCEIALEKFSYLQ